MKCVRCQRPISPADKTEPYTYPSDGRRVHSRCVGKLIAECLDLMAKVPANIRYLEPEGVVNEEV